MAINCDCSDVTGYRTLAELRSAVLAGLGFIDPLTSPPTKTLAAMRSEVIDRLGLADPMSAVSTRSLADLRVDVLIRAGNAALVGATLPPGTLAKLDSFINEAQQTLFRRLELDKGGELLPAVMSADTDKTTLDYVPVMHLAAALWKADNGGTDAKAHFEIVERYLADWANRRPPNIEAQIDAQLRQAQEVVYRRYEQAATGAFALAALVADDDVTTVDYHPVQLLALAHMKQRAKHEDAKLLFEEYERYMLDQHKRMPANARGLATQFIKDAQRQVIRRYPAVRMDRWFSWALTAGERFYGLPDNDEQDAGCTKQIDPLTIKWIGVTRDETRCELRRGIPPQVLDMTTTGWPSHYEIKQCIELWPAPAATEGTLRIRAGFVATAFTADDDTPSVDDELVYLLALANAKAYWKQPDTDLVIRQFEVHLSGVVAGSHGPARYIPGRTQGDGVYVEPKPSVPFA